MRIHLQNLSKSKFITQLIFFSEVPINVSYKGEKEKNKILDVANFLLQVLTFVFGALVSALGPRLILTFFLLLNGTSDPGQFIASGDWLREHKS